MDLEQQRLLKLQESRRNEEKKFEDEYDNFKEEYGEENDDIDENDFKKITTNKPKEPSFPYFIFGLAVLKDGLDIVIAILSLATAGIALTILIWVIWISSLILGTIIWIWIFSKAPFQRKKILQKMKTSLVGSFILEMIPGLNALPMASINVFLIYKHEKEITTKTVGVLEKLKK